MPAQTRSRRWLFAAATALVALAGIEFGARALEWGRRLVTGAPANPYVAWTNPAPVFHVLPQDGVDVYQRTHDHWILWADLFPVEKDPRAFRVFCLGGSAAMGWPHWADHAYPALLERKLEQLYPDRIFEVINVAGNTYGSHRVKYVFDEVVEYDPDLVLVYSGNNEFLETFVYAPEPFPSPWRHLAVARILRDSVAPRPRLDVRNYGMADQVVNRLSFAFGRASRLREDPAQFEHVLAHYRYNIGSMVEGARDRGVPIMLLTVPVNLRDWVPNVSTHRADLDAEALAAWREHFRRGVEALEAGEPERAARELARSVEIDGTYAEGRFRLAGALRALGRVEEARREYEAALEWDAYPFRSLPRFRRVLEEASAERDATLVDAAGAVSRRAADGIPGYDVLVDYVHPTVASNEAIAHAVLEAILAQGLLPARDPAAVAATRLVPELDPKEELVALRALYGQHLVMRQYDRLPALAERAVAAARRVDPEGPDTRSFALHIRMAQQVIEPYRRLLRAEEFGTVEEEFTPEQAEAVFQAYADFVHAVEARDMPDEEFRAFLAGP